jgi:hypothetical protein
MLKATAHTNNDPFIFVRDPGESTAARIVRETLLEGNPPELVFRQNNPRDGYALIVPRMSGERMLTVPGLNEADFTFHGDEGTSAYDLANFIADSIAASSADHLRLPLLHKVQAERLRNELSERLPDWILHAGLSAISPIACGISRVPHSLKRAIKKMQEMDVILENSTAFPEGEIRAIHERRWGGGRSDSFYKMLSMLVEMGCAELVTARLPSGQLVAAQLDILGDETRHFYYMAAETMTVNRVGSAVLGFSLTRFLELGAQHRYSFGRGSERYKYQFADSVIELYELRGFFVPALVRSVTETIYSKSSERLSDPPVYLSGH